MSNEYCSIRDLMHIQTDLSQGTEPYERVVGALFAAGVLRARLDDLSDAQIGELVFDYVLDQLDLLAPEIVLCQGAIDQLLRSPSGQYDVVAADEPCPLCPECGCPMTRRHGIDEPDYFQCAGSNCRYKSPVEPGRLRRIK
jgi:hypothetical protein